MGSACCKQYPSIIAGGNDSDSRSEKRSHSVINNMPDLAEAMRLFQHCDTGSIVICLDESIYAHESIQDKERYCEVFIDEDAKAILRSYQYESVSQREEGPPPEVERPQYTVNSYNTESVAPVKWQSPFQRFPPEKRDMNVLKDNIQY